MISDDFKVINSLFAKIHCVFTKVQLCALKAKFIFFWKTVHVVGVAFISFHYLAQLLQKVG